MIKIVSKIFVSIFVITLVTSPLAAQKKAKTVKVAPLTDRQFWLQEMDKMVRPVLYNLAKDSLKIAMPKVTSIRIDNKESRIKVQYVEVLGRVLSGIAPLAATRRRFAS